MIRILKSSAGSGKTFNLAKTYIKLLLSSADRYSYRHILAVTFTNKATAEMKNRILKELDILARVPEESDYIKDFGPMFGGTEAVRRRSAALLKDILHDYSAFSVSTIDKFFQQALRAFARELGQFSSYKVELDKASLIHESVDRVLDSIGNEGADELRSWLADSLMNQIEDAGRFSFEDALYLAANRIKDDSLREELERSGKNLGEVFSRENLRKVRSVCTAFIKDYRKKIEKAAASVVEGMEKSGLEPSDFNRHFSISTVLNYVNLQQGTVSPPSKKFLSKIDDATSWFTKANQRLVPVAESSLSQPLSALRDLFSGKEYITYRTAVLLNAQVYSLGLACEVEREFAVLQDEKSVICIDDSNLALRDIIAGSNAPFVYEKLGVRYEHFLLDEFQDTSAIQWENFRPLLYESDANGGENLLVGDVKQSIYRWRGGDWRLLSHGVKQDFSGADDSGSLRQNWRSLPCIVNFNNAFFSFAARMLDMQCGTSLFGEIYSDVVQEVKTRDEAPGLVKCSFCDSVDEQYQEILSSVHAALEAGATLSQIAVLVRTNSHGSDVAAFLLQNGIRVISDDSMKVKSSVTVRRLVSLLCNIEDRNDSVGGYVAETLDIPLPVRYDSLYSLAEELLRSLRSADMHLYSQEVLYIQSFMDILLQWTSSNGNSLSGFLRYWDDEDPMISSPQGVEAVRILTIHKSKGLEYPYVIYPFAGDGCFFKSNKVWCVPELSGTELQGLDGGVYDIDLSKSCSDTFFADRYKEELLMQYIDGINTFYVALTRAEKVLHIISATPSAKFMTSFDKRISDDSLPSDDFIRCSELLYWFLETRHPEMGRMYDFSKSASRPATEVKPAGFLSWPLKGRMRVGGEVRDALRARGIAMHKILSEVDLPPDLPAAVKRAAASGIIEKSEACECQEQLLSALESVVDMGWFSTENTAVNERGIIDSEGGLYRPDRVVVRPDNSVTVIDYKFGEDHPSYASQVRRYCRLFREMGYVNVSGWLWFVPSHKTVKVV